MSRSWLLRSLLMIIWFITTLLITNIEIYIINHEKTNYIIFRSKNKRVPGDNNEISVNNIVLWKRVHSLSFFGVTIDEFLDWKTHIKNVTLKVSRSIGVLSKLKFTVPQNVLMLLYNSIVLPHLSYCNIVWGNSYSPHLNKMKILQKRAIRILRYSMYNSHTKLLFSRMKVLPVQELISLNTCIFMYHFHTGNLPHIFQNMFISNSSLHSHNTRQTKLLHKPPCTYNPCTEII